MSAESWVWQGFEGPIATATSQKMLHDAMDSAVVGAVAPARGQPPLPWNRAGTRGMFAVQVRPGGRLPCPAGMEEADASLVGRLVGA
jgi:hypothetical protein